MKNFNSLTKKKKVKSNEVEIESGIESDSSNADQQIAETTKDSNHKPALLESSEVLSKADKQFLSKLFINLDTNNSNSRNLRESNSFNYGSIVPIIHSKFNNKTENKTDGAIKNILPSTFVSNKLLAKSFNNSQYVAPSANRVKSFVNAYSSKSIESTSAKKSSSFRSTQIVKPATESKQGNLHNLMVFEFKRKFGKFTKNYVKVSNFRSKNVLLFFTSKFT